jgi:hypothetical protein
MPLILYLFYKKSFRIMKKTTSTSKTLKFKLAVAFTLVFLPMQALFAQVSRPSPPMNYAHEQFRGCSRKMHENPNLATPVPAASPVASSTDIAAEGTCPASPTEWGNLSASNLISTLTMTTDYECFRPLFRVRGADAARIYTSEKIIAVANYLRNNAASHNGSFASGLYGPLMYLRILVFVDGEDESYTTSSAANNAIIDAANAFGPRLKMTPATTENYEFVNEFGYLMEETGRRHLPVTVTYIKNILKDLLVTKTWKNITNNNIKRNYANAIVPINFHLFRSTVNGDKLFQSLYRGDAELRNLVLSVSINSEIRNEPELVRFNKDFTREFARTANFMGDAIRSGLEQIMRTYPRLSALWYEAFKALAQKTTCSSSPLCENFETVNQELNTLLFPNTFKFDDGKMVVRTALTQDKVQNLYHASKEVQAQFFGILGTNQPVTGDKNETLNMIVFKSPEEYDNYGGGLFDIPTDNGGIYIERRATFYTWDRIVPLESTLTLEELFRHEYTHYLQARYNIPGFFGDKPLYDNGQMTWYEEGMANFFAGSTDFNGPVLLKSTENTIRNNDPISIDQIFKSTYESPGRYYYVFGNALWHFLYKRDRPLLRRFFSAVRAANVTEYNNIKSRAISRHEANFKTYLTDIKAGKVESALPTTKWITNGNLNQSSYFNIKNEFDRISGIIGASIGIEALESNPRFKITGNLSVTSLGSTNRRTDSLLRQLNSILKKLENESSMNNLDVAVGYISNITTSGNTTSANFVITGPVKSAPANARATIRFSSPTAGAVVQSANTLNITAFINDPDGLHFAEIFINNQSKGVIVKDNGNFTWTIANFSTTVPLGENTIKIVAVDRAGAINEASIKINHQIPVDVVPGGYCEASVAQSTSYITNVTLGSAINNTTGHAPYSFFSQQTINVRRGQSISSSVTLLQNHWIYNDVGVWVDWNRDGDFLDANEEVYGKYGPGPYNFTIAVPANAAFGKTRIRFRMGYGRDDAAKPCEISTYFGEFEDYVINVQASSSSSTRTGEIVTRNIIATPNPFNESFLISSSEIGKIQKVEIFSVLGQAHGVFRPQKQMGANLPSGVYMLLFHKKDGTVVTEKIIKL